MTGNPYIQRQSDEPQDWQQLAQENGSLRAIIGELLIKNQRLRWELQEHGCWPAHDPKLLMASEGMPLRKKARTAGKP
jgi:hypothetical protein